MQRHPVLNTTFDDALVRGAEQKPESQTYRTPNSLGQNTGLAARPA
jgi:hypothetical protein